MPDIESAKRYFFEAVALLDAGDFAGGALRLREALKFAPDNISILTNLAGALMMGGNFAEARAAAERVLALDARNLGARLVVAECLTKDGRHSDAVAALDAIVALEPGVAEHHSNRSAALNRVKRHEEALASADRAIALKPDFAAAYLNRGNALADLKRDGEALAAYERAVTLDPRLAEAWLSRGVLSARARKNAEALASFDRALAIAPQLTDATLGRGDALAALNRRDDALAAYDRALALESTLASAWVGRGNALAALDRRDDALIAFDQALALDPDLASAWLGRGAILTALDRPDDARAAYERALDAHDRALALDPALASASFGRGNALAALDRRDDALAAYDRALALDPDFASAWFGRGRALAALNRHDDALAAFDRALDIDPDFVAAWIGRGDSHAHSLRVDEAIAAYEKAVALDPGATQAWLRRGNLLGVLQRYDEADAAFGKAIAINPNLAEGWHGRGMALTLRKRFEEAVAAYDRALALNAHVDYAQGYRLAALMRLCDWHRYDGEHTSVLSGVRRGARVVAPFDMIHMATSAADQLACARIHVANKCPAASTAAVRRPRGRRDTIDIAYLSADFRYHPVALLLVGLFEHHDRSRFRTSAFSFGPDDDTAMRRRIKGAFDSFVDADRIGDAALADLMAEREIDIAIDLMGFTTGCRPGIFAMRAAPIQVNYLGFPATMGASFIDYIVADSYVVPAALEPHYAERIVRLPDTFQANDIRRPYPTRIPSRRQVGLPEGAFVFCSFNSLDKITPEIFDAWMRLLRQTSDAILWLLTEGATTERNLRREAQARGVGPERIVFAPRVPYAEYLERYRAADLFVDTFPFNGGTTISDALWMGLPVVTLSGETFASRMAGSLLAAVGFPELATQSPADYERLALALASDRPRLAAIRAKLVSGRPALPLFDTARFCRHLEAAYVTMQERHLRGEPPASFAVDAIGG
jgi:protein O-GlcNAc transferase